MVIPQVKYRVHTYHNIHLMRNALMILNEEVV